MHACNVFIQCLGIVILKQFVLDIYVFSNQNYILSVIKFIWKKGKNKKNKQNKTKNKQAKQKYTKYLSPETRKD